MATIALMMEAARTSGILVNFYQTTWRYNPEDSHFIFYVSLAVYMSPLFGLLSFLKFSILLFFPAFGLLRQHANNKELN
jgi:hypothetical protein